MHCTGHGLRKMFWQSYRSFSSIWQCTQFLNIWLQSAQPVLLYSYFYGCWQLLGLLWSQTDLFLLFLQDLHKFFHQCPRSISLSINYFINRPYLKYKEASGLVAFPCRVMKNCVFASVLSVILYKVMAKVFIWGYSFYLNNGLCQPRVIFVLPVQSFNFVDLFIAN